MATLKFRDENGEWQYAPSLKYRETDWEKAPSLKYKDENGVWHKVNIVSDFTLDRIAVNASLYVNENGSAVEYQVVHKGIPDTTLYDASCDGVWLMRKDIYEKRAWNNAAENNYSDATIHEYLNSTFLNRYDSKVQALIKQIKIPYGTGGTTTVMSGANGLSTKVFLPSSAEVGLYSPSDYPVDGTTFKYFEGADNSLRVARLNGTIEYWWLRSPDVNNNGVWAVMGTGATKYSYSAVAVYGVRPCIVLPYTAKVDKTTNTIIG